MRERFDVSCSGAMMTISRLVLLLLKNTQGCWQTIISREESLAEEIYSSNLGMSSIPSGPESIVSIACIEDTWIREAGI